MGGAFSSLSQSLAVNLQNTEQSKCTVPSTCQTAAVGSFVNDGTLDCETITVAANNNSSQFTCSINQTAMASANVAQTAANMANAMWGDLSAAVSNESMSVHIANNLSARCGGQSTTIPSSDGGVAAPVENPAAGACQSGLVQTATVKSFLNGLEGNVKCDMLQLANNQANTSVNCVMGQFTKADTTIQQHTKNTAKGSTLFTGFTVIVIVICIATIILAVIAAGAAVTHDITGVFKSRRRTAQARLDEEQVELKLQQTRLDAIRARKAADAAGAE